MDVTSTWILTWHRSDLVCMGTWTMFNNHLLDVSLTQNWETWIALRTLTTVDLYYFIMVEDSHEYKFIELAFG